MVVDGPVFLLYSAAAHFVLFDTRLYPKGACLIDGHEPGEYILDPDSHLFDDEATCCNAWFL